MNDPDLEALMSDCEWEGWPALQSDGAETTGEGSTVLPGE